MIRAVTSTRIALFEILRFSLVSLNCAAGSSSRQLNTVENVKVRYFRGAKYHSKFMIIDAALACSTSANFSNGMADNEESILIIDAEGVVRQMTDSFDATWAAASRSS